MKTIENITSLSVMEKLEDICIRNVTKNLGLIVELCFKEKLRIPEKLSFMIIRACDCNEIPENFLRFFCHQYSYFSTKIGFHNYPDFFFLNNFFLNNLILVNHRSFEIQNLMDFTKLTTKNLCIKNVNFMNFNSENMNHFFRKIHIQNSIKVNSMTNHLFFKSFFRFVNCQTFLSSVIFVNCTFTNSNVLKSLCLFLKQNLFLKKFKLKNCTFNSKNDGYSIFKSLKSSRNFLNSLSLKNIPFSEKSLLEFLRYLTELEKLSISFKDLACHRTISEIFKILISLKLKYFKKIKLVCIKIEKSEELIFIEFLQRYSKLEKVVLKKIFGSNPFSIKEEISEQLTFSAKTLKIVRIDQGKRFKKIQNSENEMKNYDDALKIVYERCTALKKIYLDIDNIPYGLSNHNIQFTLQHIEISLMKIPNFLMNILKNLQSLKTLKALCFKSNLQSILKIIKIQAKNLIKLKLYFIDVRYSEIVGREIEFCSNLKFLYISDKFYEEKWVEPSLNIFHLENIEKLTLNFQLFCFLSLESIGEQIIVSKSLRNVSFGGVKPDSVNFRFFHNINSILLKKLEKFTIDASFIIRLCPFTDGIYFRTYNFKKFKDEIEGFFRVNQYFLLNILNI